jgi:hypothetical protein
LFGCGAEAQIAIGSCSYAMVNNFQSAALLISKKAIMIAEGKDIQAACFEITRIIHQQLIFHLRPGKKAKGKQANHEKDASDMFYNTIQGLIFLPGLTDCDAQCTM